ncbi:MAG TPA: hypothetical protein PK156_49595 [Polyangium sp.]|nr:hypothetical protein [Polyangium sp.]
MKTRTIFSGVAAAGLTLAFMPVGCGAAQDNYEVLSRPSEQASASVGQGSGIPDVTARELKSCIENGAARLPKSSAVRFDVEPNDAGKVVQFALRQSTLQDAEVEACVRQAIAEMTVPEHAVRMRSSGPVSGGERMTREQRGPIGSESDSNNPFVLWMVVEAVGVETIIEVGVGIIAAVGTLVLKKDPREECLDKYEACQNTPLGRRQVDKWGTSLCETCRKLCVDMGGAWPLGVVTTSGFKSCR